MTDEAVKGSRPTAKQAGAVAALLAAMALAVPLTEKVEGRVNDPYWDIAHVRTVCYGETRGIEERHHSNAECTAMLGKSLRRYGADVQACLPPTTPIPTLAAFSVFAYNVGAPNACASSAARKVRAGDIRGGCDSLLDWNKVRIRGVLVTSRGLDNRRAQERALCLEGVR